MGTERKKLEKKRSLTAKNTLFVMEYLKDLNGTQAAVRAGYSLNSADRQAVALLKKPEVIAAIQEEMDKRSIRCRITADDALKEIAKLSFSDVRGIFDESGRLLPVHQLPPDVAAAISSVKVTTRTIPGTDPAEVEYVSEIKFWDKRGSLELLGKHLKLFKEVGSEENPLHAEGVNFVFNLAPTEKK